MGHIEHTQQAGAATRGQRFGWRTCLRKGCGRRYPARHWKQRYCRKPDCLLLLCRSQAAKRQQKRRATAEGRQKHAQAQREQRRRKKEQASTVLNSSGNGARGHAITASKNFSSGPLCDRPGCFEPPRTSIRAPARYCGNVCSQVMRGVRDRERKWKSRKTKAGRLKRRLEYEQARRKRRQRLPNAPQDREGSRSTTPSRGRPRAVGVYRDAVKPPLISSSVRDHQVSPHEEVPHHDPQTRSPSRSRAPPTC